MAQQEEAEEEWNDDPALQQATMDFLGVSDMDQAGVRRALLCVCRDARNQLCAAHAHAAVPCPACLQTKMQRMAEFSSRLADLPPMNELVGKCVVYPLIFDVFSGAEAADGADGGMSNEHVAHIGAARSHAMTADDDTLWQPSWLLLSAKGLSVVAGTRLRATTLFPPSQSAPPLPAGRFVLRLKFQRVAEDWVPVAMQLRQIDKADKQLLHVSRCVTTARSPSPCRGSSHPPLTLVQAPSPRT